jgi:phage terminase large subunit GpA-like protein
VITALSLAKAAAAAIRPPQRLTPVQWAQSQRFLVGGKHARPGAYDLSLTPYITGMLQAAGTPGIRKISVMKAARVGVTEGLVLTMIGYYADQKPGHVLHVWPKEEKAIEKTKDDVIPMFSHSPNLRDSWLRRGGGYDQSTDKRTVMGATTIYNVGANAPNELKDRSVRLVTMSECDEFPAGAIELASQRVSTFADGLVIAESTPDAGPHAGVAKLYEESDKRVWKWPCLKCGAMFAPSLNTMVWGKHQNNPMNAAHSEIEETVGCRCIACRHVAKQSDRDKMNAKGAWFITQPAVGDHAGFTLSKWVSPFQSWAELVGQVVVAKGHVSREWVTHTEGRPHVPPSSSVSVERALTRCIPKELGGHDPLVVPAHVHTLVMGVDVQSDRVFAVVLGVGKDNVIYLIYWNALPAPREDRNESLKTISNLASMSLAADSDHPMYRKLLEIKAQTIYRSKQADVPMGSVQRELGQRLEKMSPKYAPFAIGAMAIDSGDRTDEVYSWCLTSFATAYGASIQPMAVKGLPIVRGQGSIEVGYEVGQVVMKQAMDRIATPVLLLKVNTTFWKQRVLDSLRQPPVSLGSDALARKIGKDKMTQDGGQTASEQMQQQTTHASIGLAGSSRPHVAGFDALNLVLPDQRTHPLALRELAEHLTSEMLVTVRKPGHQPKVQWQIQPGRENHFLDATVYALARIQQLEHARQFVDR